MQTVSLEFTQIDLEMSFFVEQDDVMNVQGGSTKRLMKRKTLDVDTSLPSHNLAGSWRTAGARTSPITVWP